MAAYFINYLRVVCNRISVSIIKITYSSRLFYYKKLKNSILVVFTYS